MFIGANTENGIAIYWNGYQWTEDPSEAMEYRTMEGYFEIGKLEADYIELPERYNYHGVKITSIYEL